MAGSALAWDLFVRDGASPGFLKVAGAADKAATSTERAARGVEAASTRMAAAGAKMTKAITLPLVGIAAVSVNMAAKFQQSTNVLVTAAGETTANLKLVRKGILDIASSTGTSWQKVTDGMYQLEKAGYRGAAALKVEKAAAQAAREEGANLSTVTAAATSIMASYHLKASDAVSVMNQMKTAAGESKTTMEEFAGSLSTVLPLASANKVSFADIAGSLASLTQHGTSADESTQELAFALRALSAPNNVAQKEMAQLGISSVDVAKRLGDGPGGRGLAGTLKYLAGVVASKTGPSGKLVLSTLNASKVAAHDASVEFNALAPATQKLAKQFINGTISSGEWTQSVKGLSPQQAALARQFAITENNARGFQQQLRNGVSVTQTSSDALKKMAGGANGLNVILQTTGESMKGTDERIKRIAEAAKLAGTNVSGWASTQKLFAVQLDIAKQKMAVVAIQLGTALLPAVMKIVGGVQKAVGWFQHLSGTDKKILGWSLAVMAALGPLLSLGARFTLIGRGLGAFVGGTSSRLASLAGATEASAVRINTAMRGMTAAMSGVGIGLGIGMLTKNSSNATKAIGVLGSTAAGAAIGFGAGGPLGAAIGGLAGGLTSLATGFLGAGHAAKASIKATDDYTQAILADSDAVGANTRKLVENDLQKRGLYDAGLKLGVSQKTLTDAVMGNAHALDVVRAAQARVFSTVISATNAHHELTKAQKAQNDASGKLTSGLGALGATLAVNKRAADNLAAADGKAKGSIGSVGDAASTAKGKLSNLNIAGTGLDHALTNLAKQHKINVDTASAQSKVTGLLTDLGTLYAAILNPPAAPPVKGPQIPGVTVPGLIGAPTAKGTGPGGLGDGWFTVGEQGYELGHKSGSKVAIYDNKTSQKMTGLSKVPGFATGTKPSAASASSLSDMWSGISTFLATALATETAASELKDAASSLLSSSKDWKVSSAEQARLSRDASVMGRLAAARDRISARLGTPNTTPPTAYDRLGAAQSAYSDSATTTRQAVMGSFDITTAGQNSWGVSTTSGILAAIKKAAANAGRFATLVKRLAKEGLNRHLLEQLTAAGPSTLGAAEALAKATPKQLATINSSYKSITNTGYSLGKAVADDFYKAGVTSAENLVKGLLTKRSLLNKTISNLGTEMVLSLENSLGLASGHMTKAQYTAAEKKIEATFNIQGVTDPEAFAQAVARRLAKLVA